MGDRGNIYFVQNCGKSPGLYFYGHWAGYAMPAIVQKVIRAGRRLTDEPYFARIVFDALIGKQQGEETGFGVTTYLTDNEHAIMVVDVERQLVAMAAEGDEAAPEKYIKQWSFSDFAKLEENEIDSLGEMSRTGKRY